jgi:hypothetical protein
VSAGLTPPVAAQSSNRGLTHALEPASLEDAWIDQPPHLTVARGWVRVIFDAADGGAGPAAAGVPLLDLFGATFEVGAELVEIVAKAYFERTTDAGVSASWPAYGRTRSPPARSCVTISYETAEPLLARTPRWRRSPLGGHPERHVAFCRHAQREARAERRDQNGGAYGQVEDEGGRVIGEADDERQHD